VFADSVDAGLGTLNATWACSTPATTGFSQQFEAIEAVLSDQYLNNP